MTVTPDLLLVSGCSASVGREDVSVEGLGGGASACAIERGLDFDAKVRPLLTDDDVVACRLWFDCTPTGTLFGLAPTGRRFSFREHVFYRFRDGRSAQVWSLIDRDAVATQLTG
jgi:ketosteroid isomerase-like protein